MLAIGRSLTKMCCKFSGILDMTFAILALTQEDVRLTCPRWRSSLAFEFSSVFKLCPLACPSGSFKPTQGDEPCMQCPINSRTTSEGAMNCICRNGYYRTDSDPLQMPCTSTYLDRNYRMNFCQTCECALTKAFLWFISYLTYAHFTSIRWKPWDQRPVVVTVRNPVRAVSVTAITLMCP